MKLKLFDTDSIDDRHYLLTALIKFQKEVFGKNKSIELESFITGHYAIYLIVDDKGGYVGFSSFNVNRYFSLREPTVGNTYLFIEKSHRRSKAMHLISIQAGKLCEQLGYPLEHYIVDGSGSEKFVNRLDGKKVYTVYEFELDEVKRETNRLMSKVNIKE